MTKKSLESIIPHVTSSLYDVTLYICDNDSNQEMKDWLKSLAGDRVRVFLCEKNMGKARIINKIYKEHGSDCDYFISIDSDLIVDEEYNFIDSMVWYIHNMPQFGLLSTFQKGNDQHIWNGLKEKAEKNGKTVSFGRYNSVAGGCVILPKKVWDSIGNYSTYGEVYGFDDGLMMQSVFGKSLKVGVMDDVKLTHPHDDDKGYKKWKSQNISKRTTTGYYETENS